MRTVNGGIVGKSAHAQLQKNGWYTGLVEDLLVVFHEKDRVQITEDFGCKVYMLDGSRDFADDELATIFVGVTRMIILKGFLSGGHKNILIDSANSYGVKAVMIAYNPHQFMEMIQSQSRAALDGVIKVVESPKVDLRDMEKMVGHHKFPPGYGVRLPQPGKLNVKTTLENFVRINVTLEEFSYPSLLVAEKYFGTVSRKFAKAKYKDLVEAIRYCNPLGFPIPRSKSWDNPIYEYLDWYYRSNDLQDGVSLMEVVEELYPVVSKLYSLSTKRKLKTSTLVLMLQDIRKRIQTEIPYSIVEDYTVVH